MFGPRHRIVANEGSAVAHAIGLYASTHRPALVYMQNSGLGNALNPLVSLAHHSVMAVPMVLLIGWRGELQADGSQLEDEPQHMTQGRITPRLLDLLDIPWEIVGADSDGETMLQNSIQTALRTQGPTALLVRRSVFSAPDQRPPGSDSTGLTREEAIRIVLDALPQSVPLVAATGMTGREVSENSEMFERASSANLLVVGGMGHCSAIAGAIARERQDGKVLCLDGDGSVLMHMGALPHVAIEDRLIHVMLNNGVHDSVGGQPTIARSLNFEEISKGYGYDNFIACETAMEVKSGVVAALDLSGSSFIEVTCDPGHRSDLKRPFESPKKAFEAFESYLSQNVKVSDV